MNSPQTQVWVAQHRFAQLNDAQKKIVLLTLAILIGMVLFPPKAISAPSMFGGMQQTIHWGYCFILSDPAAEAHGANDVFGLGQLIQSHIEFGRLAIQIAIVGLVAFFAIKSQDSKA